MNCSRPGRYRESAAVTAPTKVCDEHNTSFVEEHALDAIAKETEIRLQHQREQNREARQFRNKELEKNARDDDDGDSPTIPSAPVGSTHSRMVGINGTSTNSLLLQKFLNGDIDLRSIEQRDLRRLLSELELKYKTSMIANSSLYNDKQALFYQVDVLKDMLEEQCETLNQAKRQFKDKSRDFELQKRTLIDLQYEFNQLKQVLISREKLIEESGMQLCNGEDHKFSSVLPTGLIAPETLALLNTLGEGSIDEKLKRVLNEKHQQFEQIVKLKSELDNEKNRLKTLEKQIPNAIDLHNYNMNNHCDSEQQKQLTRELNDLKMHLQQFEADNKSLQQENKRCEVQLTRHKQQLEDAERGEEDLKQERTRLKRELRIVRDEFESERPLIDVLKRENKRLRELVKHNESLRSYSPTNFNDIQ